MSRKFRDFSGLGVWAVVEAVRIRAAFLYKNLAWKWMGRRAPFVPNEDLVLIVGLTRKVIELAHAETKGRYVVIVEQDAENPLIAQAQSIGAVVWVGDGRSEPDLQAAAWKRPARIWIMTNDTRKNLFVLELVRRVFAVPENPEAVGEVADVDVYIQTADFQERRNATAMDDLNRDGGGIMTHLFNQEEAFAEWLIKSHPVRPDDEGRLPRVLLIGLGHIGRAIMRELIALCHFPGDLRAEILLVDAESADQLVFSEMAFLKGSMAATCDLLSVKTEFKREDAQAWLYEHYRDNIRGGKPFSHVFVCIGSEFGNIALARRISAWEMLLEAGHLGGAKIVPIGYERVGTDFWDYDEDAHVHPFFVESVYEQDAFNWRAGCATEMAIRVNYAYERIWTEPLERLRGINQAVTAFPSCDWGETFARVALWGVSDENAPAQQPRENADQKWRSLSEHKRRSCFALARYLFNRFGSGAGDRFGDRPRWKTTFAAVPGSQVLQCLEEEARSEHRRWTAFMRLESHGPATPGRNDPNIWREANKELGAGVKVRDLARLNRNLVDYDHLDDETKAGNLLIVAAFDWIKKGAEDHFSQLI